MFFGNEIRLLDRYYWHCRRTNPHGWDEQVVKELRERLRQLSHLHEEITRLETTVLAAHPPTGDDPPPIEWGVIFTGAGDLPDPDDAAWSVAPFADADRLRLNVETFYFVAHRLMVLSRHREVLPGILPLQALGVQRVRNNLVEHAHEESGNLAMTFGVSFQKGTLLRSARRATDPSGYQDQGTRHNAEEFRKELLLSLEGALRESPHQGELSQ